MARDDFSVPSARLNIVAILMHILMFERPWIVRLVRKITACSFPEARR